MDNPADDSFTDVKDIKPILMPPKRSNRGKSKTNGFPDDFIKQMATWTTEQLCDHHRLSVVPKEVVKVSEQNIMDYTEKMNAHRRWALEMKEAFDKIVQEEDGDQAVPKTPTRGPLAGIRETLALFDERKIKHELEQEADDHGDVLHGLPAQVAHLEFNDADDAHGEEDRVGDVPNVDEGHMLTDDEDAITIDGDAAQDGDGDFDEDEQAEAPADAHDLTANAEPIAATEDGNAEEVPVEAEESEDDADVFDDADQSAVDGSLDGGVLADVDTANTATPVAVPVALESAEEAAPEADDDVSGGDESSDNVGTPVVSVLRSRVKVKDEVLSEERPAPATGRSARLRSRAPTTPALEQVSAARVKMEPLSDDRVPVVPSQPRSARSTRRTATAARARNAVVAESESGSQQMPITPVAAPVHEDPAEEDEDDVPKSRRRTTRRNTKAVLSDDDDDEDYQVDEAVLSEVTRAVPSRGANQQAHRAASPQRNIRANSARQITSHTTVTTPCKPDRYAQVQRVIERQDRMREQRVASPVRAIRPIAAAPVTPRAPLPPAATRSRKAPAASTATAAAKGPEQLKTEHERRLAEANAKKEQVNRERAERARQAQNERQARAQRNRDEREAELKRKQEEQREREERARLLAQSQIHKSPSRTQPSSRMGSPSRVRRIASPARVAHHLGGGGVAAPALPLLFESPVATARTPGRGPAKAAKLLQLSGEASKEATSSSPAREVRRKGKRSVKQEALAVDEEMPEVKVEPKESRAERRAREEHEAREAESAEQRRRELARQQEQRRHERARDEMERQQAELLMQLDADREKQERENRRRVAAARAEEEAAARARAEEAAAAARAEAEAAEAAARAEEEAAAERRRIESASLAQNKHLANASLDESCLDDGYAMTPEKTFKPSTADNYGIEDLSSGDETDDDNAPRKVVPKWAAWDNLTRTGKAQHDPLFDVDKSYLAMPHPSQLPIFATKENAKPKRRRGSSANWDSPIANPTKGKSRFLGY